jgi:hypothetical protein
MFQIVNTPRDGFRGFVGAETIEKELGSQPALR